jgi:hypothetical protein
MVIEALIALGVITVVAVNTPDVKKTAPEVKSVTTTLEPAKVVTPKAKPKKKVVKKVAKADPIQQSPAKDLAKSEPAKPEATNVSSPQQKTNQSNFLYYVLGLLTLGLIPAYFYFRNKKPAEPKLYTSNELNKTLQQPQQPSTPEPTPNPNEDVKK